MNHLAFDQYWMREVRDLVMTAPLYTGPDSDRPWLRWAERARQEGVAEDLVLMGSDLLAMAFMQDDRIDLQDEFGMKHGGAVMLFNAITQPQETRRRWSKVLLRETKTYYAA